LNKDIQMKRLLIVAGAVLALSAPFAANADPGHGHGHDHGDGDGGGRGDQWRGDHGDRDDSDRLPPGLAKKAYGLPPGQAKKMWRRGERMPTSYETQRYYVAQPDRYSLPTAPYGYRWLRVGDEYYLAQTQTGLITQVISALIR
jgi:Ni/Co efflux regulator RcnB